jgi:hypothetical protein
VVKVLAAMPGMAIRSAAGQQDHMVLLLSSILGG